MSFLSQIKSVFTISSIGILLSFLILSGCKGDKKRVPVSKPEAPKVVKKDYKVPAFLADSAYAHVKKQVDFGFRLPNSPGHKKTVAYISESLKRYGAEVTIQTFDTKLYTGENVKGHNIIGSVNPKAKKRIFICAHYDTRHLADSKLSNSNQDQPILGADDGGSGVGVGLEVARLLKENPQSDLGVDFVFFDLEDYGKPNGSTQEDMFTWALGSQHWARTPHIAGYAPKYGILLDMVGAKGATFGIEQFSRQFAGGIQNKIWNLAKKMNKGQYFIDANIGYATDDHYFVNTIAGWPTVDIIYKPANSVSGFGDHWHTHNDNMDVISKETLGAVGQVLTAVIYREAGNKF